MDDYPVKIIEAIPLLVHNHNGWRSSFNGVILWLALSDHVALSSLLHK